MSFSQSDQDLIEAAAKAAGIKLTHHIVGGEPMSFSDGTDGGPLGPWNPLADDGDALRLAVRLHIDLYNYSGAMAVDRVGYVSAGPHDGGSDCVDEWYGDDPFAATRRAIVRAAAEIATALR